MSLLRNPPHQHKRRYNNKFNGGLKENIPDSPLRKQMQKIGYDIVIDRGDHGV
ncbi:MAG: hypothetical protein IKB16_13565 [Lentisphaeria bacterium]|nr:hypothetical protein [Lentisphaeria bacterium]